MGGNFKIMRNFTIELVRKMVRLIINTVRKISNEPSQFKRMSMKLYSSADD